MLKVLLCGKSFMIWSAKSLLMIAVIAMCGLLEPCGRYLVRSFCELIKFGDVVSPLKDFVWKVLSPQNIHVFLSLIVYNKILTRNNLAKRRPVDDPSCLFCSEQESVQHLFFCCVVARILWTFVSDYFNLEHISSLADIATLWQQPKKNVVLNMICAASLWSLWTLRNEICFHGRVWRSARCILSKLSMYINQWKVMCDDAQSALLLCCIRLLDRRQGELLRITWT